MRNDGLLGVIVTMRQQFADSKPVYNQFIPTKRGAHCKHPFPSAIPSKIVVPIMPKLTGEQSMRKMKAVLIASPVE